MSDAILLVLCGDARRKESFVRTLSEAGWQPLLSASSMAEAASLVRGALNACIIVDAELTDIPGLKAVPILRNFCPQAKIIFSAPENTRDLEMRVRAMGVFYYYISSADSAELVAAVNDAIGAPRRGRTSRPKVLIVDDDRDFQDALRVILGPAGYDVFSAYSGPEGLDMARRERPDLILLDIIMSSTTDGFEFCREARRDPRIKHTPILGISAIEEKIGLPCPPDREPDLFPVDGYLRKPVTAKQLFAELKRLIPEEG